MGLVCLLVYPVNFNYLKLLFKKSRARLLEKYEIHVTGLSSLLVHCALITNCMCFVF